MIVSVIADPAIFGPVNVTDELTSREVLGLLRGILQNGVLLCDPSRQLVREAMKAADTLSKEPGGTQRGQRISLILQEIYKQHKKYVVSCEETKWNQANTTTVIDQIIVLHGLLQADIVISPVQNHAALKRGLATNVEIISPQDISVSRYEGLRIRVFSSDRPLDQMNPAEVEEHIGRAVKYCSVLRIYDYRMVARAKSTYKYRDGIRFVVAIWVKWCVVGEVSSRTVELYTVGNTQTQDGFLTSDEARTRLANDIVAPIKTGHGCHSTGHVMNDDVKIFHARGFEARKRAFTIDPGFDALGASGAVRRCLLKADIAAEKHFEECRNLESL
jgi:hypothetical protein